MIRSCLIRWRKPARRATILIWISGRPLKIGITCYPDRRRQRHSRHGAWARNWRGAGHEVHFISYERPFRLPADAPRLHFHPVVINEYGLVQISRLHVAALGENGGGQPRPRLDVLHVHYAVPHATAAILARAMLPPEAAARRHDVARHGHHAARRDPGYGPAIHHALTCSDAVTRFRLFETGDAAGARFQRADGGHPQFFCAAAAARSREEVRRELGVATTR
jgi:hypothetical protein